VRSCWALMDGHAPAHQLRLSLPGTDRVKPERNLGAAKPPSTKGDMNFRPSRADRLALNILIEIHPVFVLLGIALQEATFPVS